MNLSKQIAKHFKELHFGGNWTGANLKDTLAGITWQQATKQVHGFNNIATLVFHTNYYVDAVIKVLHGEALNAHDKFSFDTPIIESEEDWQALVNKAFSQVEEFVLLIEQLPEEKLWQNIADEKYGIYYRNIHGIIEHTHYHLGQIALIKKLILA